MRYFCVYLQRHDAVVYGGIAYDCDTDRDASAATTDRGAVESLSYLAGPKTEAVQITQSVECLRCYCYSI